MTIPLASIQKLYAATEGKAWEPQDRGHRQIAELIEDGWLKKCPMRCGFEAFDTGVDWTEVAKMTLAAAKATETQRAETTGLVGVADDGADPKGFAQGEQP